MSSLLGRSDNNLRAVLGFAKRSPCCMLLDEIDSNEAIDLTHIEHLDPFKPSDRVQPLGNKQNHFFEVGFHLLPDEDVPFV